MVDNNPTVRGTQPVRRRKGYWSSLSDTALVARDFYSDDPTKLADLLDHEPETDEIPEVEFSYNTALTGTGMVRCVHCKKVAANHNRGFVLQFHDGTRILIGKDCGKKLYGKEFSFIEQDYRAAAERADYLRRRERILQNKGRLIELFEAIEGHSCWKLYGDLKRQFNIAMPDLSRQLADAVQSRDGALYANTRSNDVDKEVEYEKRTGRKAPFYKTISAIQSVLAGQSFFAVGESAPDKVVPDIGRRARAALWALSTEEKSTRDLKLFFKGMGDIVERLTYEAGRVDDLSSALSLENGNRVARWTMANRMPILHADEDRWFLGSGHVGVMEIDTYGHGWVRCELPLPSTWPDTPRAEIAEIDLLLKGNREP